MLSPKESKTLQQSIKGMDVKKFAMAFDALGEPNRCLLFRALLKHDAITVGELAQAVGISESLASQHLKVLLQASLVTKTKSGTFVNYSVNKGDGMVEALRKAVEA